MKDLSINILNGKDGGAISAMLKANSAEYQHYFYPFSFEEQEIVNILERAQKDKYWGIWKDRQLAAFFMLRGFDEGYDIPAYGICVAETEKGNGLLKLSLQFVFTWCKLYSVPNLMLKVHPDNFVAKETYEKFGFSSTGVDTKNQNIIYSMHFDKFKR